MSEPQLRLIPHEIELASTAAPNEIPDGISMIKSPSMWEQGYRGASVVVAVIDTGVQPDHPDLVGRIIGGRNFTPDYGGDVGNYADNHGHGTHVAGIIAANDNGAGVVGVAPEARLLVLKALDGNGRASYQAVIDAIVYATEWHGLSGEHVNVISMSLGGPIDSPLLHFAIQSAVAAGILVVCAASNDGDGNPETDEWAYPGAYPEVVEVGAVNGYAELAYFSNTNAEVDLVAPGVAVRSTYPGGTYASMSGTSMAAPHVAGAAALILQQFRADRYRDPSESELYAMLLKRTENIGLDPRAGGAGLLQLDIGYVPPTRYTTPEEVPLEEAIAAFVAAGAIESPEYWHANAVAGQLVKGEYLALLFQKAYLRIFQGGHYR